MWSPKAQASDQTRSKEVADTATSGRRCPTRLAGQTPQTLGGAALAIALAKMAERQQGWGQKGSRRLTLRAIHASLPALRRAQVLHARRWPGVTMCA